MIIETHPWLAVIVNALLMVKQHLKNPINWYFDANYFLKQMYFKMQFQKYKYKYKYKWNWQYNLNRLNIFLIDCMQQSVFRLHFVLEQQLHLRSVYQDYQQLDLNQADCD